MIKKNMNQRQIKYVIEKLTNVSQILYDINNYQK